MSNDPNQVSQSAGRAGSLFPAAEAASFCSRPTPVVPPPDELRSFGSLQPEARISYPQVSPSSRPTYVPEEVEYPYFGEEAQTRPGVIRFPQGGSSADPSPPESVEPGAPAEQAEVRSTAEMPLESGPSVSLGPIVPLDSLDLAPEPSVPDAAPRARLPWRRWVARGLFVVLFSGVTGLLGYAFKPELERTARGLGLVLADVDGPK
jgi:hypothetical protein